MEILPLNQRPRTTKELSSKIMGGTWLLNQETGQVFKLEKFKLIHDLQAYSFTVPYGKTGLTITGILVFSSGDGIHIIESGKGNLEVKHQWLPFAQLEIITSL